MVLLQINVCCEALSKISPNLPSPGEGSEEPMLALWEGGQACLPHKGPRHLGLQVEEDWPRGAKGGPQAVVGCARPDSLCSWLPRGAMGFQPPLPTRISGPLPQPVLLSSEEQASSDLSAVLSRRERILSRIHERAGECWGLLGGPGPPPWPSPALFSQDPPHPL